MRQRLVAAREAVAAKDEQLPQRECKVAFKRAVIDRLTHENAVLKGLRFAARSEAFNAEQKSLLEETLDADRAAVAAEIEALQPSTRTGDQRQPKREKLPPELPRREIRHEPEDTTCGCGRTMQRVGEDVAEKLDDTPGVFSVEHHVRGKWVCQCCDKIVQAPVGPYVIDRGQPTTGLLAQVLVSKSLNYLSCTGRRQTSSASATPSPARRWRSRWVFHSAKLNGHDPYVYIHEVLERLPTQAASRLHELLPHCRPRVDADTLRA